jgi:Auxiliary Activity family 9 (formerly GH61)
MGFAQCVAPKFSLTSTCFADIDPEVYTFNLPACIPSADYLLRIQSLAIHNPGATPQWYISCAQLTVTGGGSKDLGPKVAIPGAFKATDPGYTANIYNDVSLCLDVPHMALTK